MTDASIKTRAIEWLRSLRPEVLPVDSARVRLRVAIEVVSAAIERGEYAGLSGPAALTIYFESLPDSVRWPRAQTVYFDVGGAALCERLLALPPWQRTKPIGEWEEPPATRVALECEIIDEWATELFQYCRQRPPLGLRMLAMMDNIERSVSPFDQSRIGLTISWPAFKRLLGWQRLAGRLT